MQVLNRPYQQKIRNNFLQYNYSSKNNVGNKNNGHQDVDLNKSPLAVYNVVFQGNNLHKVPSLLERFEGCLLGGAIGDAMGYPIEGCTITEIKNKYGESGLRYLKKLNGKYHFSDDTQMTIFTIKGLLQSLKVSKNTNEEPNYKIIYNAYKDWYKTQFPENYKEGSEIIDVFARKELYSRRGPGSTCLGSLKNGFMGTFEDRANNSASNGAAMRVSPIGLIYRENPELAFKIGAKIGAMTHGNEGGFLPAGFVSSLIANLVNGKNIEFSIEESEKILKQYPNHEYFLSLIDRAKALSKSEMVSSDAIEKIGSGYRGDEAVAISIYSILKYPKDFKHAITTAVNHSGDSDTTGAITGNIMGSILGSKSMHRCWRENIELSDLLYKCANDLFNVSEKQDMTILSPQQRRNLDKFGCEIKKIKFFDSDLEKMKNMSEKEKDEYIWSLKQMRKYIED